MFLTEPVSHQLLYNLTAVILSSILALTLASLFGRPPYLELTTHFRLQYALAALGCAGMLIALHSWKLLLIAVCCALYNLAYLVPYYFSKPTPDIKASAASLRLLQVNLLLSNEYYETLLAAATEADADVIVLQELTEECWKHLGILAEHYPHVEALPRPGGSGMAILSRYPLEEAKTLTLDASNHIAQIAQVNVLSTSVTILALHPPTPVSSARFKNRNRQFHEAGDILRNLKGPRILIGDLNTTMWSPYFTDLTIRSGLRDARLGFGLRTSWPMPLPWFLRLPIDHCLVSNDIIVERVQLGRRTGSDHRPLIVDVKFGKASTE